MGSFKAVVIEKGEGGQSVALRHFDESGLMEGDVTVRVSHSTLNYKDGLALTGKSPVVRRCPMIPGIDFAGTVETPRTPTTSPGDAVVLNGWGTGETHLGGYARARARQGRLARAAAAGPSPAQSMAIGTAGYTAMLCVLALERARPDAGGRAGPRHRRRGRRRLRRHRAARRPAATSSPRPAGRRRPTTSRASAPPRSSTGRSSRGPAKPLGKERWAAGSTASAPTPSPTCCP